MLSLLVKERLYINEVVLGTGFGVLMGPHTAKIFDPRSWVSDPNALTLEIMRVVLATGLFATGVELPRSFMVKSAPSLLVLVVPTMAIGWVTSAAFIHVLFPKLDYVSGLLVSACLTPTDPIVCAAILGGNFAVKHVPLNLRRLLAAESATNDSLAYPFLSISAYLLTEPTRSIAFEKWFVVGWLYQVILGTVLGALVGWLFSQLMQYAQRRNFIDRESYIAQYIALTLFIIGVTRTLGTDDLLAAFAAGCAVSWDGHFNDQVGDELFSSIIDLVLNCACFIYIGAWLPLNNFSIPELGLTPTKLVALFLIILALRRIPSLLLLYRWIPEINSWRQALFSGHFGVGAVFISTLAVIRLEETETDSTQIQLLKQTLQPIVSFTVLCSITVHGLSIPFFSLGEHTLTSSRSLIGTRTADTFDWSLWARRSPRTTERPSGADVERGTGATAGVVSDDRTGTSVTLLEGRANFKVEDVENISGRGPSSHASDEEGSGSRPAAPFTRLNS
ncbi:Sodium/hydrogen exchanger family-domain-containing protein [Vararia minispora EC-137]|uniref:Sodium/hydrogen exchanger family-domain-containing protein n=1 Tax=Vararia minispora EC-137 TaxID=1314806 RepID=A0ACB8QPJ1_9AGAM|nr:Sodium/hydrogen exchanger family-domain-containing protein [Vararia minispora EC-137]